MGVKSGLNNVINRGPLPLLFGLVYLKWLVVAEGLEISDSLFTRHNHRAGSKAGLVGLRPVQLHKALHLQGPHAWLNVLLLSS